MLNYTSRSSASYGIALVVLLGSAVPVVPALASAASIQSGKQADGWVITAPKRRTSDRSPAPPPPLPAGAESVTPSTIDVVVRRDYGATRSRTLRQRIARTANRIHMENESREWLFERNPIDPRRVAGTLVDHRAQALVLYEETDLRMALGIRGWADVLALGFDCQALSEYKPSQQARTIGGVRFIRYVAAGKGKDRADVWWSDGQALPSDFVTQDTNGVSHYSVEGIRAGVDAALLTPPQTRFPKYRVYDLADWLEKH
jgi:hypothetical protein